MWYIKHQSRYKYIYTFILERSAGSIPIRAPLGPYTRFSAIFPPLGLVSSRGLRPAIALGREGLARVRISPSPRPSRSASEVSRSRLRGLPHTPQSQPCFFTTTSLLGSSYSPAVTLFFFWSQSLVLDGHGLGAAAAAACCCCCPQHQY